MAVKEIGDEPTGAAGGDDEMAILRARLAQLEGKGKAAAAPPPEPDGEDPGPEDRGEADPQDEAPAIRTSPEDRREPEPETAAEKPKGRGRTKAADKPKAKPEGEEHVDPETGEVTIRQTGTAVAEASEADMAALYEEDAGGGVTFTADDLIVPRLKLLQDNSPEVKDGTSGYIVGARPGMILNTVTNELAGAVMMIPVAFERRYVVWRPRDDKGSGGALISMGIPKSQWDQLQEESIGRRLMKHDKGRDGVAEVIDTPEWSCLLSMDGGINWRPAAIDMSGTKAAVAGRAATLLTMQVGQRADGSEFTLPLWSSVFKLSSKRQGEGSESYFNYVMEMIGRVSDPRIYKRARTLADQFKKGEVEVAPLQQGA